MAKIVTMAARVVNAQANVVAALLDDGTVSFYDGEPPASASSPVVGQNLGATCRFGDPAFQPAKGGVITANAIESGPVVHRIRATWARLSSPDGRTVMDVSVGTTDETIMTTTTEFVPGTSVTISKFEHSLPTTFVPREPIE